MATWQFNSGNVWKLRILATKKLFITYGNHSQVLKIMQVKQTTARNLETVKQACQNTGPNVHNVPLGRSTINRNLGGRTVQFSDSSLRVWFQLLRICSRKPYFQSNLYFLPSINTLHWQLFFIANFFIKLANT